MADLKVHKPAYFTIHSLWSGRTKFFLNHDYQRSEAWDLKRKQSLWKTILEGLSIGVLFARKTGGQLEILDGQQRLTTIMGFHDEKFGILSDSDSQPLQYRQLQWRKKLFKKVKRFKIWYIPVTGGTEDQVSNLFLRLQEGQPLNPAEILNVKYPEQTELRDFVIELADHHLFIDRRLPISYRRFAHRYLIAQCLYTEWPRVMTGNSLPKPPREDELGTMYHEFSLSLNKRRSILMNFDRMYLALGSQISSIKKSDFVLIYAFMSRVVPLTADLNQIGAFLDSFFTQVGRAARRPLLSGYRLRLTPYEQFKSWRAKGATSASVNARFRIIQSEFHHRRSVQP